MARKIANVTTGGQLIGIYGGNFLAAFRWPILLSLGMILALVSWGFWHGMSEQEVYFCGMRMWAWLWNWFEFSATKEMVLNVTHSDRVKMTAVEIMQYPLVANAWTHATNLTRTWAAYGMVIAIPACVGWTMLAEKFGASARDEKFEKGAVLTDWRTLRAYVTTYNDLFLAPLYQAALGRLWRFHLRFMKPADWQRTGLYRPYTLADIPFPATTEQSHVMLVGSTGKGKTVVLRDLVSQVRARGGRAVIFDLTGAFVEAFFDPERDVILNPTDQRCPQWSVFNECDSEVQFNNAAMALIPSTGERDDFWKPAARALFVDIAMRLKSEGRGTNQALHDELMTAELAHLHELAKGTIAAGVTDPEAPKMAEGVRSTFNINARALRLLPTKGELFSIRDWVIKETLPGGQRRAGDGILFLTSRHIDMATTRSLLTLWMDTAVNTLMTLPTTRDLRMWFIIDEVGALHRLPSIENGMQAARQYGGAFVLGIHAFAKLADTYGENIAMTLSSYANTKLVMGTADHGTAKWASEAIGAQMFREMEEGYSYGQTNVRDAVTLTPRKVTEALVIPDQLMKLPKLWGYMVFPEGMPVALVPIRLRNYSTRTAGFLAREIKDDPWSAEDAANDVLNEPPGHGPNADQREGQAVRTRVEKAEIDRAAASVNAAKDHPHHLAECTSLKERIPADWDRDPATSSPSDGVIEGADPGSATTPTSRLTSASPTTAGPEQGSKTNVSRRTLTVSKREQEVADKARKGEETDGAEAGGGARKARDAAALGEPLGGGEELRALVARLTQADLAVLEEAARSIAAARTATATTSTNPTSIAEDEGSETLKDESEGPGGSEHNSSGNPGEGDARRLPNTAEREPAVEEETSIAKPIARHATVVPAAVQALRDRSDKAAQAKVEAERARAPAGDARPVDTKADAVTERDEPSPLETMMGLPNRASNRTDQRRERGDRGGKGASRQQRAQTQGNLAAAIQDQIDHQHRDDAKVVTGREAQGAPTADNGRGSTKPEVKSRTRDGKREIEIGG